MEECCCQPPQLIAANFVLQLLKLNQINTVFVQQKEMDRVGFEPTTSAQELAFLIDPLI
jgi:hypothetical protein